MTVRAKSETERGEFSGQITRQLVDKAEQVFGASLRDDHLVPVLSEVLKDVDDLAESERQQLREIAQLMSRSRGGENSASVMRCAGAFEMTPSADGMWLTLSVQPSVAGGQAVTVEDVLQWLRERNITRGVDMLAIRRAVAQAEQGKEMPDIVVVTGRAATPGSDARIDRLARLRADGELEPVNQRLIDTNPILLCRKGDVVMRYVPAVVGESGHNALGEAIEPPAPLELEPISGRNIERIENDFLAKVNGVVVFEGCHVEARKAMIINQDLTRKSDPIDFDGEVHIRAAVRSGATVRATSNVIVEGPVEAAEIESVEGDIVLRNGVAGQSVAVIHAGRDIIARFTESASLFAGRDITLQVGSLHSRLIAHRQVTADQGKGQLAGGTVMAGEKVVAKQLGARGGVRTDVTVGLGDEVLKMLSQIDQLTGRAIHRRTSCTELITQIERAIGDPAKLSPRELDVYTKLRQLQLVCDVQIRKLNARRKTVIAEHVSNTRGRIEVLAQIISNVHVTIGTGEFEPHEQRGPCTVLFDERTQKIAVRPGV